MKKIIWFLLLISAVNCSAQQSDCRLTLKDAPSILGLTLGMTPVQARSAFGKDLKIKIKKEGSFFQNYIDADPPASLKGIRALYLRFFDTRLYQIEVFYQDGGKQTAAEFKSSLNSNLKLPIDFQEDKNGRLKIDCSEFSVIADNVLNPRIELTDEMTYKQFQESEAKKAKKK